MRDRIERRFPIGTARRREFNPAAKERRRRPPKQRFDTPTQAEERQMGRRIENHPPAYAVVSVEKFWLSSTFVVGIRHGMGISQLASYKVGMASGVRLTGSRELCVWGRRE